MARGWESKSVEAQQETREARPQGDGDRAELELRRKRESVEMSRRAFSVSWRGAAPMFIGRPCRTPCIISTKSCRSSADEVAHRHQMRRERAPLRGELALRVALAEEDFARAEGAEVEDGMEAVPSPLHETERHTVARTDHHHPVAIGRRDLMREIVDDGVAPPEKRKPGFVAERRTSRAPVTARERIRAFPSLPVTRDPSDRDSGNRSIRGLKQVGCLRTSRGRD